MMHLQHHVTLIFTLAALLQLPLTNASTQECIQLGDGLPILSMSSFSTSLIAQCPNFGNNSTTIDCIIDFSDSSFASSCKSAGGEVYDYDYFITCPSSDSDGTRNITANNFFVCAAKNCTTDDMKAIFEGRKDIVSVFGDGCSVEAYFVASASAQECRQQSYRIPTSSYSSFSTSIEAQCPGWTFNSTTDCVVDLSDSLFASSCKYAGGEVYDVNYTITCPSSDSDGTGKITATNDFWCAAKVCTTDDIKALFEEDSDASQLGDGCSATFSVETYSVVSAISAGTQECIQQSDGLPTLSNSSFLTSIEAQCPSFAKNSTAIDCVANVYNGTLHFPSSCKSAGGKVYMFDFFINCPTNDSDVTRDFTIRSMVCAAKTCSTYELKAWFFNDPDDDIASDVESAFGDDCSIQVETSIYLSDSFWECVDEGDDLPFLNYSAIRDAQCPGWTPDSTSDCSVDYDTDSNFTDSCKSAGGEVYAVDRIIICPSSDADGTRKYSENNNLWCVTTNCTTDGLKAFYEDRDVESAYGDGCYYKALSVEIHPVVSGSMVIRVSSSLICVLAASLLFLVNIL